MHPHNLRTPLISPPGTAKKRKSTHVKDTQEHQSQVHIPSSLAQKQLTHMPIKNRFDMDLLKRQCFNPRNLRTVLKQTVDTVLSHHPQHVMTSNDSQVKQLGMSTSTSVSSGSISYVCPPRLTKEHKAEKKHNTLKEKGSDERSGDITESYTNFKYFLSHTTHLPERSLACELRDGRYLSALYAQRMMEGRVWMRNNSIVTRRR